MKLKFSLMMVMFFFLSCTKYSGYLEEGERIFVTPQAWGIESFRKIDWAVGFKMRQTLSRGFLVRVKMPTIKDENLASMMEKKNIDGWLLKVIRRGPNSHEVLGHVYIPLPLASSGTGQISLATFQVNYHASSVSERFSRLSCPAFNHRKYLEEMEIEENYGSSLKMINVTVAEEEIIAGKVASFAFNTQVFSGGVSLAGIYEVQLAFYNFKNKTRMSNFLPLPQIIRVSREEDRVIEGCGGETIEALPTEKDPAKSFKFGQ